MLPLTAIVGIVAGAIFVVLAVVAGVRKWRQRRGESVFEYRSVGSIRADEVGDSEDEWDDVNVGGMA